MLKYLLVALLFSGAAFGQESTVKIWTLEECVNYALENNLTVQRTLFGIESNEIKEMSLPDDEPVTNLGELEETESNESTGELEEKAEIPDLSLDLDEEEAEQIREIESDDLKLVIEDLGLELETIKGQNTQNDKLDSNKVSEKKS